MADWLVQNGSDVLLSLHVQPGAKKTEVAGMHGAALKIRLAAPPVDGRANECLIGFLAKALGIAKNRVSLQSGAGSREKRVRISELDVAFVQERLV